MADTQQTPQISGGMKNLIASIRKGGTVEQRNETELRGIIQAAHTAETSGGTAITTFWTELTTAIPSLCSAVAGAVGEGAKTQSTSMGAKTGG